jgi:phenylacetate-CoA ligase
MVARMYFMHGLRPDDVVHSVYGHGMVNAGHYIREVVLHYTNAVFLSAGTGLETRSRRQVELMKEFGATVLVGFADYIRHLAGVAREAGIEAGRDIPMRMISTHLGPENREALSEAWGGAEVYEWYGVADTGAICGEGPDRNGFYVMEDAHVLEIIDPEIGMPVPDGEPGNLCVTVLFKDDYHPVIRFDTKDVSAFETTPSDLGWTLRRTRGFLGRQDDMIKLRGINIYPTAVGALLREVPEATGEFLCRVDTVGGRDELTVQLEVGAPAEDHDGIGGAFAELVKTRLGVSVAVEPVGPGALAAETGLETRQKAIRLIDNRQR